MSRFFWWMGPACLLLILGACVDLQMSSGGPAPNFKRYQPIYMNVSGIEVVEEYRSPGQPPNIEHRMAYSPADAMQIWVKQRLRAAGGDKTMQVIIKDASVVAKDSGGGSGFFDVFPTKATQAYDARLEVELRIYGDSALSEASVNIVGTRALAINELSSARSRDQKFRGMIEEMMATMNAELEKNIFQYLGSYVNFSMNP